MVITVCCLLALSSCEEDKEVALEQESLTLTYVYNGEKFYEKAGNVEIGIFDNKVIEDLLSSNKELFIEVSTKDGNTFVIFDKFTDVKEKLGLVRNPFDVPIGSLEKKIPNTSSKQEIFIANLKLFLSYDYTLYDKRVELQIHSNFLDEGEVLDIDLANVKDDAGDRVNFKNKASSLKYFNYSRSCNYCTDRIVTQILDVDTGKKTSFFYQAGERLDVANLSWVRL